MLTVSQKLVSTLVFELAFELELELELGTSLLVWAVSIGDSGTSAETFHKLIINLPHELSSIKNVC